uniref:Rho GDP-dissociation inhibitor n=1 Tax=Arcella intermedia TaxID=1963864 RepID=A0A6B2LLN6_9EUKA
MKGEKDESLRKYLISLGMDPDYVPPKDDPRRVVISEFAIVFKDHDVTQKWTFNTPEDLKNVKKNPLVIKEKAEYKFRVTFRVQHNIVLGLKLVNTVFSKIKEVKDTQMFGSYPPSNEFKAYEFPTDGWHEAPSGMAMRGEYKARMTFTDDDNKEHLTFDYVIKIAKDWKD